MPSEFLDALTRIAALGTQRRNEGRANQQLSLQKLAEQRLRDTLNVNQQQFTQEQRLEQDKLRQKAEADRRSAFLESMKLNLGLQDSVAKGTLDPTGKAIPLEEQVSRRQKIVEGMLADPGLDALTPDQEALFRVYGAGLGINNLPTTSLEMEEEAFKEIRSGIQNGPNWQAYEQILKLRAQYENRGIPPSKAADDAQDRLVGKLASGLGLIAEGQSGLSIAKMQQVIAVVDNPVAAPDLYKRIEQVAKREGLSITQIKNSLAQYVGRAGAKEWQFKFGDELEKQLGKGMGMQTEDSVNPMPSELHQGGVGEEIVSPPRPIEQ